MSSLRVIFTPQRDITPEAELDALARVYAFLLRKHQERKKAAPASRPDGAERRSDEVDTTRHHTK